MQVHVFGVYRLVCGNYPTSSWMVSYKLEKNALNQSRQEVLTTELKLIEEVFYKIKERKIGIFSFKSKTLFKID